MKQASLDSIRVMNKLVTNKLLIRIAGKSFGHLAILTHTGRKSGKHYRIPIIAEPVPGGFVIALTYGKKVDWYENVKASGGCSLFWKNQEYRLVQPRFIVPDEGVLAFPKMLRPVLKRAGIEYYLQLDI